MTVFTVHEQSEPAADRIERAENLAFVKDGFSWGALLFGPFWLAANGLWLALAGYLGLLGAVAFIFHSLGLPAQWTVLFYQAMSILLAFEASSLKRWTLSRNGWSSLGTVVGRNQAECERRFFEDWLPVQPILRVDDTTRTPYQMHRDEKSQPTAATAEAVARDHQEVPTTAPSGKARAWWPFATGSS